MLLGVCILRGPLRGNNKAGGDAVFRDISARRPAFRQLAWGC